MKGNHFTAGLITGGLIGFAGLAWALGDSRTRRRMGRDTRKLINKAGEALENASEIF
ncbi:MAG: hypothetical protein LBS21_14960 [Clostridiales bacterium]|jgi:hypothetical protein|nr:hypothetical protein [Clostridiales bacterium]